MRQFSSFFFFFFFALPSHLRPRPHTHLSHFLSPLFNFFFYLLHLFFPSSLIRCQSFLLRHLFLVFLPPFLFLWKNRAAEKTPLSITPTPTSVSSLNCLNNTDDSCLLRLPAVAMVTPPDVIDSWATLGEWGDGDRQLTGSQSWCHSCCLDVWSFLGFFFLHARTHTHTLTGFSISSRTHTAC